MPIQLTPEQEQRVRAVVDSGAYTTPEEAVDAAVAAMEGAAVPEFDGTQSELEALLHEGLQSGEPVEADEAYWTRLRSTTDQMVVTHLSRNSTP